MKNRLFFFLCTILLVTTTTMYADTTDKSDCPAFDFFVSPSSKMFNVLLYEHGTKVSPYIDSILVTSASDPNTPLLISHVQSGSYINASKLERGMYKLCAYVGDCIACRLASSRLAIVKERDIISESPIVIAPHQLLFTIRENGQPVPPHIDSLWIVGLNTHCTLPARVYMTKQVQSGDTIDIKPLLDKSETEYQCIAWINGTDYWSDSFSYNGECDADNDVQPSFTIINPHHAVMHLTGTPAPHVDSLWLTNYDCDSTFLFGHWQDGDTIDLAPLVGRSKQEYKVWLKFGDCLKNGTLTFNGLEYDYCLDAGIWGIHIDKNHNETAIQYTFLDYTYHVISEELHPDSVWITSFDFNSEEERFVRSCSEQPGQDINVQGLTIGLYNLNVQIGGCYVRMLFNIQHYTAIDTPVMQPVAIKLFRDNQLIIIRDGKAYSVMGFVISE